MTCAPGQLASFWLVNEAGSKSELNPIRVQKPPAAAEAHANRSVEQVYLKFQRRVASVFRASAGDANGARKCIDRHPAKAARTKRLGSCFKSYPAHRRLRLHKFASDQMHPDAVPPARADGHRASLTVTSSSGCGLEEDLEIQMVSLEADRQPIAI